MSRTSKYFFRIFGALHIAFGLLGALLILGLAHQVAEKQIRLDQYPYERPALYSSLVLECVFLLALVLAGALLFRLKRNGVVLSNFVLSAEIVYWVAYAVLSTILSLKSGPNSAGTGMAAVAGIGGIGLSVQLITGYPVIALVCLNLVSRKLNKSASPGGTGN